MSMRTEHVNSRIVSAAAASVVLMGLSFAGFSSATASIDEGEAPEVWFSQHIAGPESDPLPGVVETRLTTFDADAAVTSLVSVEGLASARQGQYVTAIPQTDVVLELFDGRNVAFEMDDLALRLPYDNLSTNPHIDAGGTY